MVDAVDVCQVGHERTCQGDAANVCWIGQSRKVNKERRKDAVDICREGQTEGKNSKPQTGQSGALCWKMGATNAASPVQAEQKTSTLNLESAMRCPQCKDKKVGNSLTKTGSFVLKRAGLADLSRFGGHVLDNKEAASRIQIVVLLGFKFVRTLPLFCAVFVFAV
jgi:hypothetical protein